MNDENIKVSQKGTLVKVEVKLDKDDIQQQYRKDLKKLAAKTKIPGFRKGTSAIGELERRSGPAIRGEAIERMLQEALGHAIDTKQHQPAMTPTLEKSDGDGIEKDMIFHFEYEVFPEIPEQDLSKVKMDVVAADISAKNIQDEITKLQEHHGEWISIERKSKNGDQLTIDFAGRVDGELFEGGSATDQKMILGAGKFLPDFEKGLKGVVGKQTTKFKVSFPKDYQSEALAGKKAEFEVVVHSVAEKKLMPVGKKLYEVTDSKCKTKAEFEGEIKKRLQKDADHLTKAINRKRLSEKLVGHFKLKLPPKALNAEIEAIQKEKTDISAKDAKTTATRNMSLSLILRHYHQLLSVQLVEKDVKDYISIAAPDQVDPGMFYEWYKSDEKRFEQIKNVVLEHKVFDSILEKMATNEKPTSLEKIEKELKDGA